MVASFVRPELLFDIRAQEWLNGECRKVWSSVWQEIAHSSCKEGL